MNMSELFKIVLTACLTIAGGIILFVLGQIIEKWFIEPVLAFKRAKGGVAWVLTFYADIYSNPGITKPELMEEASKALRKKASDLMETINAIPTNFLSRRSKGNILEASRNLIGLSNAVYDINSVISNREKRKRIVELLGLDKVWDL